MEVISIEEIDPIDLVYDLETECGTFVAGGMHTGILVKNTDSCYVKFPVNYSDFKEHGSKQKEEFMKELFRLAEECANYCTSQFKPPIELAFEKYMYPLMLFAKKRYAFKEWTEPERPNSELNYKGIQLVRRDTCRYVKEELNRVFEIIMDSTSKEAAMKESVPFIQRSIKNLLDSNIDINKLVLSKQLKARYIVRKENISNTYHWTNPKITQPHVRLAQELKIKNPANHPKPPDRVPYLFIEKKGDNLLQCDKVVHPEYLGTQKIDSLYYFEHQYRKPIDMIFQFIMLDSKGNPCPEKIYERMIINKINEINGQKEISSFFKKKNKDDDDNKKVEYKYDPTLSVDIDSD